MLYVKLLLVWGAGNVYWVLLPGRVLLAPTFSQLGLTGFSQLEICMEIKPFNWAYSPVNIQIILSLNCMYHGAGGWCYGG